MTTTKVTSTRTKRITALKEAQLYMQNYFVCTPIMKGNRLDFTFDGKKRALIERVTELAKQFASHGTVSMSTSHVGGLFTLTFIAI